MRSVPLLSTGLMGAMNELNSVFQQAASESHPLGNIEFNQDGEFSGPLLSRRMGYKTGVMSQGGGVLLVLGLERWVGGGMMGR